jgi:hypothetical protein
MKKTKSKDKKDKSKKESPKSEQQPKDNPSAFCGDGI